MSDKLKLADLPEFSRCKKCGASWEPEYCAECQALIDLLHQIQISDYKDENGHRLVDNEAYLKLKGSL